MKAVILAGGFGTRISEETHLRPKPMIEIGGKPILWHIMKLYSAHGVNDFVICCGYRGYVIKEYFANYFLHMSDVTFDVALNKVEYHKPKAEPWRVTLVDTGDETMTGGRLKRVGEYVANEDVFCLTYGDGIADVDISREIGFHRAHGRLATVTAVKPPGRYGALQMDHGKVSGFVEKPPGDGGLISGGFFVLSPKCLDLIEGDDTPWEGAPLAELAKAGQLMAFEHAGFLAAHGYTSRSQPARRVVGLGPSAMEGLVNPTTTFWSGRSVFLTGHTGFKGGWLAIWLHQLGAAVHGFALDPPTNPSLFDEARVGSLLASDTRADLRDLPHLMAAMSEARPEVVFHLAAQALVRVSYLDPIGTFATNALGTAHVLEAVRAVDSVRSVVVVTSDKVYDNRGSVQRFLESDPLGGRDPYSASKAAAEIVTASYRSSFLGPNVGHEARLATARAGNVIGGADWAAGRLVPDCLRAFEAGEPVRLRHPDAIRPWQHVLEPLSGYLMLGERLYADHTDAAARPWNFGPEASEEITVGRVADLAAALWGEGAKVERAQSIDDPHEEDLLKLDSTRARLELGWAPRWSLAEALDRTMSWHRAWRQGVDPLELSKSQLADYETSKGS